MLREINLTLSNLPGANQFSQSALTISKMPNELRPLSKMADALESSDIIAKVGMDPDPKNLNKGYLINVTV